MRPCAAFCARRGKKPVPGRSPAFFHVPGRPRGISRPAEFPTGRQHPVDAGEHLIKTLYASGVQQGVRPKDETGSRCALARGKSGAAPATVSEDETAISHCARAWEGAVSGEIPLASPETGLKRQSGIAEGCAGRKDARRPHSHQSPLSVRASTQARGVARRWDYR
jgi:hypothetical protein